MRGVALRAFEHVAVHGDFDVDQRISQDELENRCEEIGDAGSAAVLFEFSTDFVREDSE